MNHKLSNYKANILYSIVILAILVLAILLYSGPKEGYSGIFLIAIIIVPMMLIIKPLNNTEVDLSFAFLTVTVILFYAIWFWTYKDRPPVPISDTTQLTEELRGGLFSFENPLRLKLLITCSAVSILISMLIRQLTMKLKTVRS